MRSSCAWADPEGTLQNASEINNADSRSGRNGFPGFIFEFPFFEFLAQPAPSRRKAFHHAFIIGAEYSEIRHAELCRVSSAYGCALKRDPSHRDHPENSCAK